MKWETIQDNFKSSTFGDWLNIKGRQKIYKEELFGVRILIWDILNLEGQWGIQVWKKLSDSEQMR